MEVGSYDEEVAFATFLFFVGRWREVMVEGAFGGFVELFGIEGFVGGCVFVFWRIGCWLDHWYVPICVLDVAVSSSLAFE